MSLKHSSMAMCPCLSAGLVQSSSIFLHSSNSPRSFSRACGTVCAVVLWKWVECMDSSRLDSMRVRGTRMYIQVAPIISQCRCKLVGSSMTLDTDQCHIVPGWTTCSTNL